MSYAAAGLGAGAGALLGLLTPNQQGAYDDYSNQMQNLAGMYKPWMGLGLQNMQAFSGENAANAANPMGEYNKIASTWQASPAQQNLMHNTTQMMNNNAAETGMLGSTAQNDRLQSDLTNMTNQFQNQYINTGLGQYNNALRNQFMTGQQGFGAMGQYGNMMQEGALGRLQGARANDQWMSNILGGAAGGALGGLGKLF